MNPIDIAITLGAALAMFLVPGVVLWIVYRDRCNRWISSVFALLIAIASRLIVGHWNVRIGGESSGEWYVEIILGGLNWALAALFVRWSYCITCDVAGRLGTWFSGVTATPAQKK